MAANLDVANVISVGAAVVAVLSELDAFSKKRRSKITTSGQQSAFLGSIDLLLTGSVGRNQSALECDEHLDEQEAHPITFEFLPPLYKHNFFPQMDTSEIRYLGNVPSGVCCAR